MSRIELPGPGGAVLRPPTTDEQMLIALRQLTMVCEMMLRVLLGDGEEELQRDMGVELSRNLPEEEKADG